MIFIKNNFTHNLGRRNDNRPNNQHPWCDERVRYQVKVKFLIFVKIYPNPQPIDFLPSQSSTPPPFGLCPKFIARTSGWCAIHFRIGIIQIMLFEKIDCDPVWTGYVNGYRRPWVHEYHNNAMNTNSNGPCDDHYNFYTAVTIH